MHEAIQQYQTDIERAALMQGISGSTLLGVGSMGVPPSMVQNALQDMSAVDRLRVLEQAFQGGLLKMHEDLREQLARTFEVQATPLILPPRAFVPHVDNDPLRKELNFTPVKKFLRRVWLLIRWPAAILVYVALLYGWRPW